jgi:predicted PurR-regulated permease PerM
VDRFVPASVRSDKSKPLRIPLDRLGESIRGMFGVFAGFLAQAAFVGLYLMFMMVEASRFPRAIRRGFPPDRAQRILDVVDSNNYAVVDYLSVKVRVILLIAVPAALLMMAFRVEGAVLGGVVTFFARDRDPQNRPVAPEPDPPAGSLAG